MNVNALGDYVTPSKQFLLPVSILSGIIMCKIVYEVTGLISLLLFKGHRSLSKVQKIEWNNRGFSTFHAFVVAIAAFYLLVLSDLFDDGSHDESIVNRNSNLSNTILGISIGYFLSDLGMILWLFPALGGLEYVSILGLLLMYHLPIFQKINKKRTYHLLVIVGPCMDKLESKLEQVLHHGLSMFSIFLSLISGQGQIYILMVLFSESTTPLVNLRWYLDLAGQKGSKLYICNGIAMFLGWLVARILLFIFFFVHMFLHFDEVKEIFPLGFYSLLVVPPILTVMNVYWFWKIVKGLIKTLSKARHSR